MPLKNPALTYQYLVSADDAVLLQVNGPIKPKPGQRIVLGSEMLKPSHARYDAETDSIVKIPASAVQALRRERQAERALRAEAAGALEAELRSLVADDPKLRRVLELVSLLPKGRSLRALSAGEDEG